MTMTKGERDELRRLLRQRFKVLRAEVEQRRLELAAEAAQRVQERYTGVDKLVDDVNGRIASIVDSAHREIRDLMSGIPDEQLTQLVWVGHTGNRMLPPQVGPKREDRFTLKAALTTGIDAHVHTALVKLDRQEADLMERLVIGVIESKEAREFLRSIPTVAELVPATRLAELEARWDQENHGQEG